MRNTRSEDARKIPPDEQSKGNDLMGPSHRTQAVAASFSSGFSRLVIVLLCEIVVVGLTVSLGISPALAVDFDEMNRYANYVYDEFSPDRDAEALYVEVV